MFSLKKTNGYTQNFCPETERLKEALESADAVVIGAGAGLSFAAGFTYSGDRFERYFHDFHEKYGITDMYSGGFYPFRTSEEYWAWWSRHIMCNRYVNAPYPVYDDLLKAVKDKDYFVLTTNVDHQFQSSGFDKKKLFYTQGDYGLWQCSKACHAKTYDNKEEVYEMIRLQKDMGIPSGLIPYCPLCGAPMTMNLRCDDTFVQDEGWYEAAERYRKFMKAHGRGRVLFLELGVGGNTPGIIKYPFWNYVLGNNDALYVTVNQGEAFAPPEIRDRSLCISDDIRKVLFSLSQ